MLRNAAVLAILFQTAFCIDITSAAEKTKGSSQKQTFPPKKMPAVSNVAPSKLSVTYSTLSFDVSTKKVPLPYLGHDIEQVYEAFDKRKKAEHKDEFETTEQYQRRLADQAVKPLYGSVGQDSVVAFVMSLSSEYDADSQTLSLRLLTSAVWQSAQIDASRLAVEVKRGEVTKQKSTGQNAYGAKVEIEERHAKGFELAIHNVHSFETEKVLDESGKRMLEMPALPKVSASLIESMKKIAFVQRLKTGPEQARDIKDKISALILAKPIAPYISYGAVLRKATFKEPTEFFGEMYYLDVVLVEIWIYDKLTGEIITKIKSR